MDDKLNPYVKAGIFYGIFMFLTMTIVLPLYKGDAITPKSILIGMILWTTAGILFGYFMSLWGNTKS